MQGKGRELEGRRVSTEGRGGGGGGGGGGICYHIVWEREEEMRGRETVHVSVQGT